MIIPVCFTHTILACSILKLKIPVPFDAYVAESLIIANTTALVAKNMPYARACTHEWMYKIRLLIRVTKRVQIARVLMDAIRQK